MPAMDFAWATVWPVLVRIFAIFIIAVILRVILTRLIRRAMSTKIRLRRDDSREVLAERTDTLTGVLVQLTSIAIWIVAALMILSEAGGDITPVLATVGLGALAIGLAAQNIVRDYLNGFFILMEDWYRVGEVAVISGTGGLVEAITLRRTLLRDLSGTLHIIPNSKVEMASNMTRDWARINLNVGVAYKENLGRVFEVINEVGQQMKDDPVWGSYLLTVPHAERVDNLGDSGIEIKILADTKPIRQWALMGELRKRLKDRFDEEGIEIPWPHTKVYFGDEPPAKLPPQ